MGAGDARSSGASTNPPEQRRGSRGAHLWRACAVDHDAEVLPLVHDLGPPGDHLDRLNARHNALERHLRPSKAHVNATPSFARSPPASALESRTHCCACQSSFSRPAGRGREASRQSYPTETDAGIEKRGAAAHLERQARGHGGQDVVHVVPAQQRRDDLQPPQRRAHNHLRGDTHHTRRVHHLERATSRRRGAAMCSNAKPSVGGGRRLEALLRQLCGGRGAQRAPHL